MMKNIIKIITLLSLLPLSVFANTSLQLEDPLSQKNKKTLTVAIEKTGYFPFNYKENGKVKGFSIDVLNYISENSNYNFNFIVQPWTRGLSLVAQGKIDLILTVFKTKKRQEMFNIIEPSYGYEINQLFTLAHNNIEFSGQLQQLTPYSIGTITSYSYGEAFDQATYINKYSALSGEVLLKLLLGKRVDAIIGNPFLFERLAKKGNVSTKIKVIEPYISTTPVYIALTKERQDAKEIKQALEQLIKQLIASPYYQQLLNKYHLNFT